MIGFTFAKKTEIIWKEIRKMIAMQFFNAPTAPVLDQKERLDLYKWLNTIYKENEDNYAVRSIKNQPSNSLFAHPDNVRYLATLVGQNPPEWYVIKYKKFLFV